MLNTVSNEYRTPPAPRGASVPQDRHSRFEEWVDVNLHVEPELGIVEFVYAGVTMMMYAEDIDAVSTAAAESGGTGLWCDKYSKLLIPSTHTGAGNRFFTLIERESVEQEPSQA